MTIVEFYDREIMDNAAGTLMLRPDRTIFLCSGSEGNAFAERFAGVLEARGINTELVCEKIDISSVDSAYETIRFCIEKYGDCDFDITGGAETVLVAVGRAAGEYNVKMHRICVETESAESMNGISYRVEQVNLTVRELILLSGGRSCSGKRPKETFLWQTDKKAEIDTDKVWKVCRSDCGAWNAAFGTARGYRTDKRGLLAAIWLKLKKEGLVLKTGGGVKYSSEYVEYLLQKQGTALEMYTYMAAKEARGRNGERFFADGESGVVIHWRDKEGVENEIDVLLTHGVQGYFVSCKNGSVISDELYKLSIVAGRFGGKYAKKILVLSQFEPDKSFMERAGELNVTVIKNVRSMSKRALAKKLMNA